MRPQTKLFTVIAGSLALTGTCAAQAAAADPVVAAAGDIACAPNDPGYNRGNGTSTRCRQRATSDLLVGAGLSAVLPLGDIQYQSASLPLINTVYHPTWGRVRSISRPVLGNHEGPSQGYFDYFNGKGVYSGRAGPRDRGYYSYDLGGWHLIALNSNCHRVACAAGSRQERWLRADLAAHPTTCTLAYWHDPRFSSGHGGSSALVQPFWEALHDAGAEVVLTASSHHYERFAPLSRAGTVDPVQGIRQFVVGTGGAFLTGLGQSRVAGSEVSQNHTFGVLKLTLHPSSYDWQFAPIAGRTFTDSGTGACQGPPPTSAPVISSVSLRPRRFGVYSAGRGATFRYTLSKPARVSFTIARRFHGRRVGNRCRPRTRANRAGAPCRGYRRVGSFARDQAGRAGRNARRFRGKIGQRPLPAAAYRARLVGTDVAGNRSRPIRVSFELVRR